MRHGDAFAGIGGFALAARRRGWRTVWAAEIDDAARAVYSHRLGHPALRFDRDIRESRDLPPIDILTGGFPCQDLSIAGRKEGLAGGRSGLFFQLPRLLVDARPRWFVFENVTGLLSSHRGRDMAAVLSSLVDCGYGVAWRVLDARYFGVAQRRRRVFLVGHSGGDPRRAAEVLFEPQSLPRDPRSSGETKEDIAGTLGSCSSVRGGFRTTDLDGNGGFVVDAVGLTQNQRGEIRSSRLAPAINAGGGGTMGQGYPAIAVPTVADPISTVEGRRWTSEGNSFRLVNVVSVEEADADRMREAAGLPRSLDLCPVCAEGEDGPRYRGIGNAVAVPVVEWIFNRIEGASDARL